MKAGAERVKSPASDYYQRVRTDLLKLAPEISGSVLDVGCGEGATLRHLLSHGVRRAVGVEYVDDAVEKARGAGLEVFKVDLNRGQLPFGEKEFDCILFGDVLEHLIDPWQVLRDAVRCLKDDGTALLSIPNVKHYRVLRDLIFLDSWEYTEEGILDSTHLRFFTLRETRKLIAASGLAIAKLEYNIDCPGYLSMLNFLLGRRLSSFITVQYLIAARKAHDAGA